MNTTDVTLSARSRDIAVSALPSPCPPPPFTSTTDARSAPHASFTARPKPSLSSFRLSFVSTIRPMRRMSLLSAPPANFAGLPSSFLQTYSAPNAFMVSESGIHDHQYGRLFRNNERGYGLPKYRSFLRANSS